MVDQDPTLSVREAVLDAAKACVLKDRNDTYGLPEDNFSGIAEIWNAQGYRAKGPDGSRFLEATDVALMMVGMKLGRLRNNPDHRDSWVDVAGYAACGAEVAERNI